ncbi:MAG: hypothetical protein V8R63_04530 [Thomasclavelia ramosa]
MIQGKGFDEVVTMMQGDFKIVFLDSETLGSDIDVSKLNRYGDVTIYHQSQDRRFLSGLKMRVL